MDSGQVNKPVCPRCGHFIPTDENPGAYPGALSRTDNYTEVCSACGSREAMEQWRMNLGDEKLTGEPAEWWTKMRGTAWFAARLRK